MREFKASLVPTPNMGLDTYPGCPLDLEIGCGVGLHPIMYAQQNPTRHLIALDRSKLRLSKMRQSLDEIGGLENLIIVCEDADKFVVHEIRDETIENLFLLYPNPYPKDRQANKRWHQMPLMQCFLQKLIPGGMIHIATNMEFYAQEAKVFMQETWQMKVTKDEMYQGKLPFAPRTHFEKKYLERGEKIFDLAFKKQD